MKRKAKKQVKDADFYREVALPELEIKKYGNSCCIRIPVKVMKKELTLRKRVRPFLVIFDGESYRHVSLPITEIRRIGNSCGILIIKPMMRRHKLEVGMKVVPHLFLRDKLNTDECPEDEIILVIDGKVSTIKKVDYYVFKKWKKQEDKKYREIMKDYL